MTSQSLSLARLALAGSAIAVLAGAGGYSVAHLQKTAFPPPVMAGAPGAKPLYYYDPMVPAQHFDKPGKSPFMDMQLVPRYADSAAAGPGGKPAEAGVQVDPAAVQSLGVRLAVVQRGTLAKSLDATGVLDFNQRDVAVVQARAAGFVQRVYARAPGDVLAAGAPIADLLVPAWGGAEEEYLAVRRTGDPSLTAAAGERLRLLGVPDSLVAALVRDGRAHPVVTVRTPLGGAIQTLDVRQGMTVSAGQTLAQVSGLSTVWLNAAAPEALAGGIRPGAAARIAFAALPGEHLTGRVVAVLPSVQADSRTITVRIELPNRAGRLRPGMFATVHLDGPPSSALLVPSEAVIQTGARALVMVAGAGGRFQPVEIRPGRQAGDRTEVLDGLSEGQKVVASGQFLLDSEANLNGVQPAPLAGAPMTRPEAQR